MCIWTLVFAHARRHYMLSHVYVYIHIYTHLYVWIYVYVHTHMHDATDAKKKAPGINFGGHLQQS